MEQRFWLACYDIGDDKRLRRVAAVMERYGTRAQKSVFECWITPRQLAELRKEMAAILDPREDSLRFYTACEPCRDLAEKETETVVQKVKKAYIV